MSNLFTSLIRTWVPIGVGTLLTFLAVQFGLVVDENIALQLTAGLTGLVIAVYYLLARIAERIWPALGVLLGSTQKPVYVEPSTVTEEQLK